MAKHLIKLTEIQKQAVKVDGSRAMYYAFTGENLYVYAGPNIRVASAKSGDSFIAESRKGSLFLTKCKDKKPPSIFKMINEVFGRQVIIIDDLEDFDRIKPMKDSEHAMRIQHLDMFIYMEDDKQAYLYIDPLLNLKTLKLILSETSDKCNLDNFPVDGDYEDYLADNEEILLYGKVYI